MKLSHKNEKHIVCNNIKLPYNTNNLHKKKKKNVQSVHIYIPYNIHASQGRLLQMQSMLYIVPNTYLKHDIIF